MLICMTYSCVRLRRLLVQDADRGTRGVLNREHHALQLAFDCLQRYVGAWTCDHADPKLVCERLLRKRQGLI